MSLSELTEQELWEEYAKTKSYQVRNELVKRHILFVSHLVGRNINQLPVGLTRDDLFQFGVCGLIEAIERFDPTQGATFKTYASFRIQGAIKDQIRAYGKYSGGLTRSAVTKAKAINETVKLLEKKLTRHPSPREIAEAMNVSLDDYITLLSETTIATQVSLDEMVGMGENLSVAQVIKDEKSSIPEETYLVNEYHELLSKTIDELPKREKMVITLYYFEELTLKEIGYILNVSEGRVSQIHSDAMRKIKIKLKGE